MTGQRNVTPKDAAKEKRQLKWDKSHLNSFSRRQCTGSDKLLHDLSCRSSRGLSGTKRVGRAPSEGLRRNREMSKPARGNQSVTPCGCEDNEIWYKMSLLGYPWRSAKRLRVNATVSRRGASAQRNPYLRFNNSNVSPWPHRFSTMVNLYEMYSTAACSLPESRR